MNTTRSRVLVALTVALVIAVATAQEAGAGPTARLTQSCLGTTGGESACLLTIAFFDALNSGRFEKACSLIGRSLRLETGGRDCPSVLAMSKGTPFEIIGARSSNTGAIVLVRVGFHELDHVRMLSWAVLVGREAGKLRSRHAAHALKPESDTRRPRGWNRLIQGEDHVQRESWDVCALHRGRACNPRLSALTSTRRVSVAAIRQARPSKGGDLSLPDLRTELK